jgi:hypothetical protein
MYGELGYGLGLKRGVCDASFSETWVILRHDLDGMCHVWQAIRSQDDTIIALC